MEHGGLEGERQREPGKVGQCVLLTHSLSKSKLLWPIIRTVLCARLTSQLPFGLTLQVGGITNPRLFLVAERIAVLRADYLGI